MSGMATAVVVGSIISSESQRSAARSAGRYQRRAGREAIEEERYQFDEQLKRYDEIREMLRPYVEAGQGALESQMALTGLAGDEAQAAEIAGIEESPIFQALTEQGEGAILSRSAATGGLRGGNIQAALAQFRPAMLKSEIESKYGKLAGLAQMGQGAITQPGMGPQPTGNITSLLQSMGDIRAQEALIGGRATGDVASSLASAMMLRNMMGRQPRTDAQWEAGRGDPGIPLF